MKHLNSVVRCMLVVSVLAWVCAPLAAQTSDKATRQASSQAANVEKSMPAKNGASISGRVLAATDSKPIKGARVTATTPDLPVGRSVVTDENGAFNLTGLPAGRYTVIASKIGFLDLVYGQRRPGMSGEILELDENEAYPFTDCKMLRSGTIAGRIADETGEPLAGATVSVMQYGLIEGERRLVQAGTAQTDDKGNYRVWGLMPGDYYVRVAQSDLVAPKSESVGSTTTYFPGVDLVAEAKAVTLGISQEVVHIDFGRVHSEIAGR
jgi:hypothetical protein